MESRSYKVVNTHANEISGWKILSILLHPCDPHIGEMNGDVQSDLSTLAFKTVEHLEGFHSRIIRLQQEIILTVETVSTTILILQYTNTLSKGEKLKAFIAPKMKDLIIFLDNNVKYSV